MKKSYVNTCAAHYRRIVFHLTDFLEIQVMSFFSSMKFTRLFNQGQSEREIRVLALTLLIYLNLLLEGVSFR